MLGFRAADVKITRGDLDAAPLLSFACAVLRQVRVDLMVLCVLPWLVCCGHCVRCQCRRHLSVHGSVLRRVLRRALPADGVLPCTEVCKFAAASNGCTVFNRSTVVRSSRPESVQVQAEACGRDVKRGHPRGTRGQAVPVSKSQHSCHRRGSSGVLHTRPSVHDSHASQPCITAMHESHASEPPGRARDVAGTLYM